MVRTHLPVPVALAGFLVAALLGGCSPGPQATSTTPDQARAQVVRSQFSERSIATVVEVLASSGVGVFADAAAVAPMLPVKEPTSPLRLLRWQARNLALEASASSGVGGQELESLTPLPDGAPPISFLVAAYVSRGDTPGARFAQALLGKQDWHHPSPIVFPSLVLDLFVSDSARAAGAAAASGPQAPPTASTQIGRDDDLKLVAAVGICSLLAGFLNGILVTVFNALTITGATGIGGFFASLWNAAVSFAQGVINGLVATLTAPILNLVRSAIGVVGALSMATSLLRQWRVRFDAEPFQNHFAVGSEAEQTGSLKLRIDNSEFGDWPADVVDCAAQVGMELPSLTASKNAHIDWEVSGVPDYGRQTQRDDRLRDDKTAVFAYATNHETEEAAKRGARREGLIIVRAGIERTEVTQLRDLLQRMILNSVPPPAAQIVNPILERIGGDILRRITSLADVRGTGRVQITFHGSPEPSPSPSASAQGSPLASANPCSLITTAEAAAPFPGSHAQSGVSSAGPGEIDCTYIVSNDYGTIAVVRIGVLTGSETPDQAFARAGAANPRVGDEPGIGDRAVAYSLAITEGTSEGMLVLKGETVFYVTVLGNGDDQARVVRGLARVAASRIR